MLLDSNIIIYAAKPENADLRRLIAERAPAVSVVSVIEVLGYHRLTEEERRHFEEFFAAATILPISEAIVAQAVRLRQTRKMTLGDALMAATAFVYGLVLVTHNTCDFAWIPGLRLLDPLTPS
jgi:hypothetical protein